MKTSPEGETALQKEPKIEAPFVLFWEVGGQREANAQFNSFIWDIVKVSEQAEILAQEHKGL